ncbi:hypothetical protein DTO166G4_1245 [Paecilomyces variotii]|nr:hypothetical protein DTO166G4_1245 [Paecilomyces variotii]KAJ9242244.1 hypothetical protein DTO166G5_647 [Paecilomyces variotii]KAJ9347558.1 hypothetical protein DTO027B9_9083 [Paecilomyces variotii]KAJ9400043.1 hypothetical protein DTO282F9_3113 [Paecilomyces variotii]
MSETSSIRVTEFTVGWICALTDEFIAARQMLDEQYEIDIPESHLDTNVYTCGRIGRHRVVIACLPQGRYGQASTFKLASGMMTTFPSIKVALLVGIGGGAPNLNVKGRDIRLGDIVVGTAVLQYTSGKRTHYGLENFYPVRYMDSKLLGHSQILEALIHEDKLNIQRAAEEMIKKNEKNAIFQRPDPESDRLYESDYVHAGKACDCLNIHSEGQSHVVNRKPRKGDLVQVHVGKIGSADQVMKDASTRDQLANAHDIICFEMECAALVDNLRCITIRGICDYSDSHKNDRWHGYAAAVAAVYAKALLEIMPSLEVEGPRGITQQIQESIDNVAKRVTELEGQGGQKDKLRITEEAVESLRDGINLIEKEQKEILKTRQHHSDQLREMQEQHRQLCESLQGLDQIIDQRIAASTDELRQEWQTLKKSVDKQSSRLKKLKKKFAQCNQAIEGTSSVLQIIGDTIGIKGVSDAGKITGGINNVLQSTIAGNSRSKSPGHPSTQPSGNGEDRATDPLHQVLPERQFFSKSNLRFRGLLKSPSTSIALRQSERNEREDSQIQAGGTIPRIKTQASPQTHRYGPDRAAVRISSVSVSSEFSNDRASELPKRYGAMNGNAENGRSSRSSVISFQSQLTADIDNRSEDSTNVRDEDPDRPTRSPPSWSTVRKPSAFQPLNRQIRQDRLEVQRLNMNAQTTRTSTEGSSLSLRWQQTSHSSVNKDTNGVLSSYTPRAPGSRYSSTRQNQGAVDANSRHPPDETYQAEAEPTLSFAERRALFEQMAR